MNYKEKYNEWCNNKFFDEKTRQELLVIKDNDAEIEDRFYKDLDFGTAGLRGVIGSGTNRMNEYTVRKATQGLSNFIIKEGTKNKGVVIAYDCRNMSKEFSEYAANTLNANGIRTYVFEALRPVPELSYAVRKLRATTGIVITASHNPPQYNGYKVYWDDGAQIVPPKDKLIINEVNEIEKFENVKTMDKSIAIEKGLYISIGEEIDNSYITELKKLVINYDAIKQMSKEITIVYTPLHGTGTVFVKRVLTELGFENVYVVPEQEIPDGNFPTVVSPNPENKKAFELALNLAKELEAELVLATDPDADRLGIYVKDSTTNEYIPFTGNMSGLLIAEYVLSQKKTNGTLPKNGAIIKSIVSSMLAKPIANEYGVTLIEVLTGFKYIGEQMRLFDEKKEYEYLFGYEESYGCLIGTYARDKDAISAVITLCEMAAYYKLQGLTLWDQMINIYKKYGYYKEEVISLDFEGVEGAKKISEIIGNLRKAPLKNVGKNKVLALRDYQTDEVVYLETGEKGRTGLPKSDVLYYELENDGWCCVRPSGTEPKIKFYIGVNGTSLDDADNRLKELGEAIREIV